MSNLSWDIMIKKKNTFFNWIACVDSHKSRWHLTIMFAVFEISV